MFFASESHHNRVLRIFIHTPSSRACRNGRKFEDKLKDPEEGLWLVSTYAVFTAANYLKQGTAGTFGPKMMRSFSCIQQMMHPVVCPIVPSKLVGTGSTISVDMLMTGEYPVTWLGRC